MYFSVFFSRILEEDKVIKQIKAPNLYILHLFAEVWIGAIVDIVSDTSYNVQVFVWIRGAGPPVLYRFYIISPLHVILVSKQTAEAGEAVLLQATGGLEATEHLSRSPLIIIQLKYVFHSTVGRNGQRSTSDVLVVCQQVCFQCCFYR